MAVFNRLPPEAIRANYTHHARYMGVPCYFNADTADVHEANGVPGFLLDAAIAFEGLLDWGACLINPEHQPGFRFRLNAPIHKGD